MLPIVLLAGCLGRDQAAGSAAHEPLVFAAASLRTALDEVEAGCRRSMDAGFRASYAATSALARQIEAGAPADLFVSADLEWMDAVAAAGFIQDETRVNLLGNRLVLIAPGSAVPTPSVVIGPGFRLADALGDGRLAIADPQVVPAGRYARAALTTLGVWDEIAPRVAPAENVRAALLLVARAEAPLGIVYRSDAVAETSVVVVDTFAASTHPPIVYPVALTRTARPAARRVLACLKSPASRGTFERWGFGVDEPAVAP